MRKLPRSHRGNMMIIVLIFIILATVTVLLQRAGKDLEAGGKRFTHTQNTLDLIKKRLAQFGATYQRLPCPANPTLDSTTANAGYPNENTTLSTAATTCTYPTGVVPWKALGLSVKDVTDEWGRLISYRVFDGPIGLTQTGGASKVYCDTANGGTPETYPINGLCSTDTNTLEVSFSSHKSFPTTSKLKGLVVSDFGTTVNKVAYVLISHGPSGLGGYLPAGAQMAVPNAAASDYVNVQTPTLYPAQLPSAFMSMAVSTPDVVAGTAGHFDDVVAYAKIDDFINATTLKARDWPEVTTPQFTASTAPVQGAPPTTDPLNPRFTTSGSSAALAFTAATVAGQTVVSAPVSGTSFASCLWWPSLLTLNSPTSNFRQSISIYVEFAAVDNTSDPFAGFTMGFLSGLESQPGILTCGTTAHDVPATGSAGAFTLSLANASDVHEVVSATGTAGSNTVTVSNATGIVKDMKVSGTGIATGATVSSISGTVVTLSGLNTAAVSGNVTFTNLLVGMEATGPGVGTSGTGAFATISSISGSTITLNRANTAAISATVSFSNSRLIRRDLGWAGGTLAKYTNRFAIEYDANIDTGFTGTINVATANDPVRPHLAPDFAGVTHGSDAESCTTTSYQSQCDEPPNSFSSTSVSIAGVSTVSGSNDITVSTTTGIAVGKSAFGPGIGAGAAVTAIFGNVVTLSVPSTLSATSAVTFVTTATLVSGSSDIVVSTLSGVATGMSVTGVGIGAGATVSSISGTTVTLSAASTLSATSTVVFGALSSANFMQDGLSIFHSMRTELIPFSCSSKATTTGLSGASTLTVPDTTGISVGMGASGPNVATGATIKSIAGNVLTVSLANTAAVSSTVDFSLLPDTTKAATGATGATAITVSDSRYLGIGMSVAGANVGTGAKITDILGTTVTLSAANTGVVSGTLSFTAVNPAKTATGASGQNTVSVSDTTGVTTGMRAFGDGISDATTVAGISGTTLTLSANNTDAISGTVTLRPPQIQLKSWTLSNAGCNADSTSCASMKNTSTPFGIDLSTNEQALATLACLDVPTPSTAFDDLYFGLTTSNRATNTAGTGVNISFRALSVTQTVLP